MGQHDISGLKKCMKFSLPQAETCSTRRTYDFLQEFGIANARLAVRASVEGLETGSGAKNGQIYLFWTHFNS